MGKFPGWNAVDDPSGGAERRVASLALNLALGILMVGCGSSPAHSQSAAHPSALAPASVPPVVGECSQQLGFGGDGNASPLICKNGDVNVLAWNYFATIDSALMGMGRRATEQEVQTQLCSDLQHSTIPIEQSAYTLAKTYYGWRFAGDPINPLVNDAC
ncbi:MAG: hypothetical protein WAO09_01860 [Candidatus Dormiibacterota bacterium]